MIENAAIKQILENDAKFMDKIKDFEQHYKECVKYKSKVIKDDYDKYFIIPLIAKYKIYSQKKNISKQEFKKFLEDVTVCGQNWLNSGKKAKMYLNKRKQAVNNIITDAVILCEMMFDSSYQLQLRPGYKTKGLPVVFEVPYTGGVMNLTMRCYMVVSGTSIAGKILNKDFDFINYTMMIDNQDVKITDRDMQIGTRKLYKVDSLSIDISLIGKIIIDIYISPNGKISEVITDHFINGLEILS